MMESINKLEKEIKGLRDTLNRKEEELLKLKREWADNQKLNIPKDVTTSSQLTTSNHQSNVKFGNLLPKWAIERYSRHILLPEIGVKGQRKICDAKVLVVGAGGLGCPALLYLAGAGVGEIGIVDYDTVDITNIHRQVLHRELDEGINKAESAASKMRSINSHIKVRTYNIQLTHENAMQLAKEYDLVLDCTDNVPTRYLLNDVCVMSKLPLISGSALKMEGQLTIYGYRMRCQIFQESYDGPCYRCLFSKPPPAEAVGSCSANGVAGPVPGVIGVLQALEALKCILGFKIRDMLVGRLLLFDGEDLTFRTVQLRSKNPICAVCSDIPTIQRLSDYEILCNARAKEKDLDLDILSPEHRITPLQLAESLSSGSLDSNKRHLLVDVRNESEFQMCNIDGAKNHPIDNLRDERLDKLLSEITENCNRVTFICRRGNDSQIAAKKIMDAIGTQNVCKIEDVKGGLHAWSRDVDNEFPIY